MQSERVMTMDLTTAIDQRFSVRSFKKYGIEPDKMARVMEAARLAPSASNRQEWRFVVVRDERMRERLADAARGQAFVGEAPAVIVACAVTADHVMPCGLHCFPIDVAIAMSYITLAATAEGLGTCWIGAFDPDKVREVLGIPIDVVVVGMLPIGYPEGTAPGKKRLAMDEIVFNEKWPK